MLMFHKISVILRINSMSYWGAGHLSVLTYFLDAAATDILPNGGGHKN